MSEGSYQVKVRPEKAEAVEKIRAELDASAAAVITEYRGLTVEELKVLRTRLSEQDATYRVSKNTLARRAANELGFGELESVFEGPVAVAYVKGDPVGAAKVIATFAREHPALVVKGGILEGRIMSAEEAAGLATVDPLDMSRAKIAGLLTAPLQQLMMLLEAPAGRILYVLEELGRREAPPEPQVPDAAPPEPEPAAEPEAEREVQEGAAPPEEPEATRGNEEGSAEATDETQEAPAEATAEPTSKEGE